MVDVINSLSGGFGLGEHVRQRPQRDALANLGVQRAQQAFGQQQQVAQQQNTEFGQGQLLQRATIINQSAKALANLPLEQRIPAYQRLVPRLQQMGIDTDQFQGATFSDDELGQVIVALMALFETPTR